MELKPLSVFQKKIHDALKGISHHDSHNVCQYGAKVCQFCKGKMNRLSILQLNIDVTLIVYQCPTAFSHICVDDIVLGMGQYFWLNWAPDMNNHEPKYIKAEWLYKLAEDGTMSMLPHEKTPHSWTHEIPPDWKMEFVQPLKQAGQGTYEDVDKAISDQDGSYAAAAAVLEEWHKTSMKDAKVIITSKQEPKGLITDNYVEISKSDIEKVYAALNENLGYGYKKYQSKPNSLVKLSDKHLAKLKNAPKKIHFIDEQVDFITPSGPLHVKDAVIDARKWAKLAEKYGQSKGYLSEHYSPLMIFTDGAESHGDFKITAPVVEPKPYVPTPVLTAPRSAWGKKMREKLDLLKAIK